MTLEDFFTLTEMKNGLTTCARVEELISVIQKLNSVTSSVGDAARQWSTAAATLACTENRECLRLFVHLNGLGFLNHWLQEAVQCSRDVADGEELIGTLMASLDKLPANPEKLSSSGVFATVEKLSGHANAGIRERARALLDKWDNGSGNDDGRRETERDSSHPAGDRKPSVDDAPLIEEFVENSSCQTGDDATRKADSGGIRNVSMASDDDRRSGDAPTATVSDAGQESFSVQEGNSVPKEEMASPEIQAKVEDDLSNSSLQRDAAAEAAAKGRGDSWSLRSTSSAGLSATSQTKTLKVFRSASCNLTLNEGRKPILSDAKENLHRCVSVDGMWPEYSKTMKEAESVERGSSDNQDSSKGSPWRKPAAENSGDVGHRDEPALNSPPPKASSDQAARETEKSSDSESESGEMDALEIARLVAIEVEREVVDYREELCSSSPEASSNDAMNTASPSNEEDNQGHRPVLGDSIENESVRVKDGCDATSHPTESLNRATGKFDFDLNEDACDEDIDSAANPIHSLINFSAPIAVSASKGAPVFPITPLCFDAGLGWKGSAATSAFRPAATSAFHPASPRRALDGERPESGSKYRPNLIELDLNLTDAENHFPADAASAKEAPASSGMPSRNSSSEASSLRAERIKFDLNSNGGDGEAATPSHSPLARHHFLNGGRSPSSPASSSSLRQQPRKNFDLNHNPLSSDAAVSKNVGLSMAANPHGIKADEPAITIMGSRMPAERRAHGNQTHQPYAGNGFSFDPARPGGGSVLPYPHQIPHPAYGYVPPGAAGMALPFQPAVYGFGNIQHMVDSRGATVVPQLLSSVGANGAPSTPPYLMSITNAPSSSNGGGPSQPGLDLNFGLMQMEDAGSAGAGNAKLPLTPATVGLMEEEQMNNPLKRKEPESGWESYSYGYKHLASWN